jgi:hypothetical protein
MALKQYGENLSATLRVEGLAMLLEPLLQLRQPLHLLGFGDLIIAISRRRPRARRIFE